jgi:predicted nucleic acid-binding protein
MVLVDTSAWIEFHRRDGSPAVKLAVAGLLNEFEATLCGPVEMEFLGGARAPEVARIKAEWNLIPYLRNDQTIWRKAAATYASLRSQGLNVPWNDALIATLAIEADCRAYAIDRHFDAMSKFIGLRLYEPGYNGMFRPE